MSLLPRRAFALALPLMLWSVARTVPSADACEGTPRPSCGRSIWLAKSVDATIPHPGDATPILVPVRLYPYVLWNTTAPCAQPASAVAAVVLECVPDDGGPTVDLGPFFVPVAVPTVPGLQPLLTGAGATPEVGGPYEVTIPAGALAAGTNWECTVKGEYQVTFGAGVGSGAILGAGDAKVCIVDPSPADGSVPALGMERVFSSGEDLMRCRRGDQGVVHYLISNNHTTESVTLDFSQVTNQVARLPAGTDPDATLFAISSPKKNTDNFPQRFLDLQDPDDLVPEGDPSKKDDQRISRAIHLAPGEHRVVPIAVRSHGMCLDGSCSELIAKVVGKWTDGTKALACASGVFLVDDVGAKTPLVEVTDEVKAGDTTDVLWSAAIYDKDKHRSTLAVGNLTKQQGGPGTQTTGANLKGTSEFPPTASEYLRMEWAPERVQYSVEAFPQAEGFARMKNKVVIENLCDGVSPMVIPLFKKPNGANFSLFLDADTGVAVLKDGKKKVFDGAFSDLLVSPPGGVFLESQTCRTLSWSVPTEDYIAVRPTSAARLFDAMATPEDDEFEVYDPRTGEPLAWSATSSDPSVSLPNGSGNAGDPLIASYSMPNIAPAPDTSLAWISVSDGAAINSPFRFLVATRKVSGLGAPDPLMITGVGGKLNTKHGAAKDTLTLEGMVPAPKGFKPKGQPVVFQVLGQDLSFRLDKKGKDSLGKSASVSFGKVDALGYAPFTLVLKKQDLSGAFAQNGSNIDDLTEGVPVLGKIPVIGRFFGTQHLETEVPTLMVLVKAKVVLDLDE